MRSVKPGQRARGYPYAPDARAVPDGVADAHEPACVPAARRLDGDDYADADGDTSANAHAHHGDGGARAR